MTNTQAGQRYTQTVALTCMTGVGVYMPSNSGIRLRLDNPITAEITAILIGTRQAFKSKPNYSKYIIATDSRE